MIDTPQYYSIKDSKFDHVITFTTVFYIFICFHITNYHLVFQREELLSALLVRQIQWWWIPLAFVSRSFYLFQLWRTTLLGKVLLAARFVFFCLFFFNVSAFWIYCSTLSWPARFLLTNLLIILWEFPNTKEILFSLLL